jgi:hypothetical protein
MTPSTIKINGWYCWAEQERWCGGAAALALRRSAVCTNSKRRGSQAWKKHRKFADNRPPSASLRPGCLKPHGPRSPTDQASWASVLNPCTGYSVRKIVQNQQTAPTKPHGPRSPINYAGLQLHQKFFWALGGRPSRLCPEPGLLPSTQEHKHVTLLRSCFPSVSSREGWSGEPDGTDLVTGSATVSLIRNARNANSRLASSSLEPYDWLTASLKTNFSTGTCSLS